MLGMKKTQSKCKILCAFFAFIGPTVANASSYTPISECGTVISAPGKYRVVQNIDCSGEANPQAIIIVNASDVELRLDGYQLKGKYNQTYGGLGIGISVIGSNDVKIEGRNSASKIVHFANAINIQGSNGIEVDGSRMQFKDNSTALVVLQSQDVKIDRLRFQDNRQRDLQIHQSSEIEMRNLDHFGPSPQGILVSDSQEVEIRDVNIGQQGKVNRAVIFYNTSNSTLRQSRIDQADVGVLFQGQETYNNKLRHNRFGRNLENVCDMQLLFGAEQPEQTGGSPSALTICP